MSERYNLKLLDIDLNRPFVRFVREAAIKEVFSGHQLSGRGGGV